MKLPPGYVPGHGVQKATAYGGFGEKLMKQMGWQDGQGLGRDKKGIKKAIQVKPKDDTIGVGGQTTFAWEKKWWEEAYDSKAKKIQATLDNSDSDDSDDDVIIDVNRDGTRSSAHEHERKIAAALAKDPWGRFGGREGKMARIARQEAEMLARMQGGQGASISQPDSQVTDAGASQAATPSGAETSRSAAAQGSGKGVKAGKRKRSAEELAAQQESLPRARREKGAHAEAGSDAEGADTQGVGSEKPGKAKGKKKRKQKAAEAGQNDEAAQEAAANGAPSQRRVHVVRLAQDDSSNIAPFSSTPASGWWGASRFRSAGCLEGLEHTAEHVKKERQTFTEQTQEDLYTATQAAKVTAKKGLGTSSMPRKVAGARWQGKKTLIGEDDEAEAGPQGAEVAEGRAEEPMCLQNAKWKKLAKAALLEAPDRRMSVKRLRQVVVKAALAKEGITAVKATRKALQDAMLAKVSSSSMFAVEDGFVRLL